MESPADRVGEGINAVVVESPADKVEEGTANAAGVAGKTGGVNLRL